MKKRVLLIGVISMVLALASCATAIWKEGTVSEDQYSTVRVKYAGPGHLTIDAIDGERIPWSSYSNIALTSEERIKVPAGEHTILFAYHIDSEAVREALGLWQVTFLWNAELVEGATYMAIARGASEIEISCTYQDGKTEAIGKYRF